MRGGRLLPGRGREREKAAASYDGLHGAVQSALMLSVTVPGEPMLLPLVLGVEWEMPRGDAARIRAYVVELVDDARGAGETGVTVRAGDVREALDLNYRNAVIDICQVLGTRILQGEAGVELVARRGPGQGLNSVFEFRLLRGRALTRAAAEVSPLSGAPEDCRRAGAQGPGPSHRGPLSSVHRALRRLLRWVGTRLGRSVRT